MLHVSLRQIISLRYYSASRVTASQGFIETQAFNNALKCNKTLKTLKQLYSDGNIKVTNIQVENGTSDINSERSLPMTKFLKDEIFNKVEKEEMTQWRKSIVKWFRLGVYIMKYYRDGIKNTYLIYKDTRRLISEYEKDSQTSLINQMFKRIEFVEIEYLNTEKPCDLKHLPLTRRQYVEYFRRDQIWKLPGLVISLLILEEFTAILFYLFPKLAPHNLLTPGGFLKITKSHSNSKADGSDLTYLSPYALPNERLFSMLRNCPTLKIPNWKLMLYDKLDNKKIPCERLALIHQYIFVDDWLLLRHILNNPVVTLSDKELVNCIWERQLYYSGEDLNSMVNNEKGKRVLLWRIFIYWAFRFDGTVTVGSKKMFSEKWGTNNMSLLNFSGMKGNKLVTEEDLPLLEENYL